MWSDAYAVRAAVFTSVERAVVLYVHDSARRE